MDFLRNYWPTLIGWAFSFFIYQLAKHCKPESLDPYGQVMFLGLTALPLFQEPMWIATLWLNVIAFIYFYKLGKLEKDASVSGGYAAIYFIYMISSVGLLLLKMLFRWIVL